MRRRQKKQPRVSDAAAACLGLRTRRGAPERTQDALAAPQQGPAAAPQRAARARASERTLGARRPRERRGGRRVQRAHLRALPPPGGARGARYQVCGAVRARWGREREAGAAGGGRAQHSGTVLRWRLGGGGKMAPSTRRRSTACPAANSPPRVAHSLSEAIALKPSLNGGGATRSKAAAHAGESERPSRRECMRARGEAGPQPRCSAARS